jgi:hypothetical protein
VIMSILDQSVHETLEGIVDAIKHTSVFSWMFGNGKESDGLDSPGFGLGSSSSHSLSSMLPSFTPSLTPSITPDSPKIAPETPNIAQMLSPAALKDVHSIMNKDVSPANENKPVIENPMPYFAADVSVADNLSPTAGLPKVNFGMSKSAGMSMA